MIILSDIIKTRALFSRYTLNAKYFHNTAFIHIDLLFAQVLRLKTVHILQREGKTDTSSQKFLHNHQILKVTHLLLHHEIRKLQIHSKIN